MSSAAGQGLETYSFSTGCRYFLKIAGNLFEPRHGFLFRIHYTKTLRPDRHHRHYIPLLAVSG